MAEERGSNARSWDTTSHDRAPRRPPPPGEGMARFWLSDPHS